MMDIRLGSLLRDCIVVFTEDIPSSCGILVYSDVTLAVMMSVSWGNVGN